MNQEWTPEYRLVVEDIASDRIFQAFKIQDTGLMTEFYKSMKRDTAPDFPVRELSEKETHIYKLITEVFESDHADVRQCIVELLNNTKNMIDRPKKKIHMAVIDDGHKGDFDKYLERPHRSGSEVRGLCPFHKDAQASFSGNSDTGLWFCFAGCGSGTWSEFMERIGGVSRLGG